MRDKRPVDELSIEELERILAIKKREQRIARSERYRSRGRVLETPPAAPIAAAPAPDDTPTAPPEQLPAKASTNGENKLPQLPEAGSMSLHDADGYNDEHVGFVDDSPRTSDPAEFWKRVASWGLLGVEVAAVVALAFVLYRGFMGLDEIRDNTNRTQQELSAAQAARSVTATPAPQLSPYQLVIPGGHIYDSNSPSFNQGELERILNLNSIPANQRSALVNQATVRNISYDAPPQPTDPVSIDIPAIGINRGTVKKGADWATLQAGMGWFQNGADLASGGNIVIVGHNDIYGKIFENLPTLEAGDEITIYDNQLRRYTYRVTLGEQVEPNDVRVLDRNSGADLTLITCYPYQVNTHRWIVYAERVR